MYLRLKNNSLIVRTNRQHAVRHSAGRMGCVFDSWWGCLFFF